MPNALLVLGPRYLIPALEVLLLVPLLVGNPRRMTRQNRQLRLVSIGLILLIAPANTVALVLLVDVLVNGSTKNGGALLVGAVQVWLTNVIVFALAYWELDRGGPVVRTRDHARSCRLPTSGSRRTRTTTRSTRWRPGRPPSRTGHRRSSTTSTCR